MIAAFLVIARQSKFCPLDRSSSLVLAWRGSGSAARLYQSGVAEASQPEVRSPLSSIFVCVSLADIVVFLLLPNSQTRPIASGVRSSNVTIGRHYRDFLPIPNTFEHFEHVLSCD